MTTPTLDIALGDLAAQRPESIQVLERFGLEYCCGGRRTLREACVASGVDPAAVQAALAALVVTDFASWAEAPLPSLLDHILAVFHSPHREAFDALRLMGDKVVATHGNGPEWGPRLIKLREKFEMLADDLEQHMQKEERVLFPWIRGGHGQSAGAPIRVMLSEHEYTARLLNEMRALAQDYTPPEDACSTLRGFLAGLAQLERDIHEHMHLENNVLFPRALAG